MFNGTWRIEGNAKTARLLYNVEVQPQPWLPIGAGRGRASRSQLSPIRSAFSPPPGSARASSSDDSHGTPDGLSHLFFAGLVVDRVAKDIQGNLSAVRDYAESLSQNAMVIEAPAGGGGGGKSQGASAASAR